MSPIVGKLLPKIDARLVSTGAFLIFALVFYMRAQFNQEVDFYTLMVPTVIQGAAMAMFFIPLTSIILSGQPHDKIPAAAGLSNFVRIMFGGMGTSVVSTMWDNRSILHHAQLAEYTGAHNHAFTQAMNNLTAQGLSEERAWAVIDRTMTVQASTLGATDMFWISSILFLVLIGFVWLTKPSKSAAPADAAGAH
jgi:DHA2 family multidrug resistance protein